MKKLLNIIAIGIGGGGGNMISHLMNSGPDSISYFKANTDKQALKTEKNVGLIQLGKDISKGLGAGMNPDIGLKSAQSNETELLDLFKSSDLVFISAGLGGGTGTGAAPFIAKVAKSQGALTIGVVTMPFKFEGKKRYNIARKGLIELRKFCDSVIVIQNDNLLSIIDRRLGLKESFKVVDNILAEAVNGTAGVILSEGSNDINLDFADLKTVISHKGSSLMSIGYSNKSATEAIKEALHSPILKDLSINGAKGILIHFEVNPNYSFIDLSLSLEEFNELADPEADIIFGTSTKNNFSETEVKITLIATGIKNEEDIEIHNKLKKKKEVIREPKILHISNLDNLDMPSYLRQA